MTAGPFLSRKFLLAVAAQAANIFLCWNKSIDPSVFSAVTLVCVGGYITGNVAQKATEKST